MATELLKELEETHNIISVCLNSFTYTAVNHLTSQHQDINDLQDPNYLLLRRNWTIEKLQHIINNINRNSFFFFVRSTSVYLSFQQP